MAKKKKIPKSPKAKKKIAVVMSEFKDKDLKSSSGKQVTNPKQALAIAFSEARNASKEKTVKKVKKKK